MFTLFTKKRKALLPDWISHYQALDFTPKGLIDETTYVVLDCETTGLSKSDQIITIGAVKCTSHEIFIQRPLDQLYAKTSTGKSSEIHGQLGNLDTCNTHELIKELLDFVSNQIIIGHNIAFDIGMINRLLTKTFQIKLKNKVLDTAHLAIRIDPQKYENQVGGHSNLHLDTLCKAHNIRIENRHTALGDAFLTAQLFQRLLVRLKSRGIKEVNKL